jgi:hypothetical protein
MKASSQPADPITALEQAQPKVLPGTPEMEALLQAGYGMSVAEAQKIIKERDENPVAWPLEEYRKAQAMLAAYNATPKQRQPSSTRKPWRIRGGSRGMTQQVR